MAAAMTEEVQKKNTDCVYFLASPLTCKKGSDCEFRHSESARNNPRDCWYWLSGSCLNSNCAFRHPPLEAIPEGELAAGGRSRVPCYYFMQGYCAKGDKCSFMHGMPTASVAEVSQKASKPSVTKTEVPDNQTSANKGNGSATSKTSFEFYEATPFEVPPQKSSNEVVKDVDVHAANRLPEGSDSSAPARSRLPQSTLSERSKQVTAMNGRLNQVHSSDDKFLHQEAQMEEEPVCDFQHGEEGLGQEPFGEDQIHDGTESEEMWEESSFDVLVDDGGTDQLIYADDLDYLNQYDALVDQLTRGADGFVDFDYDHAGAYGQYYDAEYELATYDAYEQQLVYDQLGSLDPEDGMQPVVAFKNRQGKDMLPRDRRDLSFDGEARSANVGSNDLRNHIVKRRRAEKNQKYGEDYNRRRHQGNGSQHNRRHQDGHFKQQEGPGRRNMSPKLGSRSNRQYPGRGEFPGGRQFHGLFVESGTKRPFRDLASDHEEMGAERGSGKKFRGMNDTYKSKARKERGRPAASGVDEALGRRGHQQSKKVESKKEDSSFVAPKTLAQIKAEKLKASQEGGSVGQHEVDIERNGFTEDSLKNHGSLLGSKISQGSLKEPISKDLTRLAKPVTGMESDFEGPKPLSLILKQKRREEGEGEARDHRHEKSPRNDGARVGLKPTSYLGGGPFSSADSLIVHDNSKGRTTHPLDHGSRAFEEKRSQLQSAASLASFSTSSTRRQQQADTHSSRLEREVDPAFDTEDGVDVGDNVMEDVDYDDDDEDDFAKQLGGFLS